MLGNIWCSSESAAANLGITEFKLSYFRENGFFKPGIHWKSSPYEQKKPWNPQVLYNVKLCRGIIAQFKSQEYEKNAA